MNINMRTFAISILSGGLIALGSSMAFAESNNIDNTSTGESGHGTGCSNHVGGCYSTQESSATGTYQPTTDAGAGATMNTNTNMNSGTTTSTQPQPYVGCLPASEGTPGHCLTGGTNN